MDEELKDQNKLSCTDIDFSKKIHESLCSVSASVFEKDYFALSELLDATEIQESCAVRNVLKARQIATELIDDRGELNTPLLAQYVQLMRENLYSLGPHRHHDTLRDEHILAVLLLLEKDKELVRILKNISRPVANRVAEEIIRDTLCLPFTTIINDSHVKRACLAAWLTYLRQSLGSCFATAPAIIIQQEQPRLFLKDIDEMMNTGRLKRTFGGVEYAVPMSITWGNGDLKKPLILQGDLERNENPIWKSYGIIVALEAAGLIDQELPLEKKVNRSFELFAACFSSISGGRHLFITNAEELIRGVLLHHYHITQSDLDNFLNKPKGMVHGGIFIHLPKNSKKSGIREDPCEACIRDMQKATVAFKALADNALIKAWEFTLASFSEIKLDFARWNLYTSLGVNFDDVGGIGQCLYKMMSVKVEHANATLRALSDEYDQAAVHMRYLEGRVKSASSEKEIEWMKMEYQSKQVELYHIEQQKQIAYENANKIAHLHEFLIGEYDKKFPDYFQEVYDAEIHDIASGPFDDSPAGFRLVFKHGRSNPSLWTYVRSASDFIEALVSFFTITEQELRAMPQIKGIEQDFSVAITQLVNHVRSDEFLESSFFRMAKAHGARCPQKPLEHLDKVEKKPWVYTSGGSMSILVSAYFGNEQRPTEISRWVESETELFAWLIDSMRQLPAKVMELYIQNSKKSMLIHSPTHAFSLKPGFSLFREAWTSDMYSYSWIKNKIVEPAKRFYSEIEVNGVISQNIAESLCSSVAADYKPRVRQLLQDITYKQSLQDFRMHLSLSLLRDKGLQSEYGAVISQDTIDALLYSEFPFALRDQLKQNIFDVGSELFQSNTQLDARFKHSAEQYIHSINAPIISSRRFIDIMRGLILVTVGKTKANSDLFSHLLAVLCKKGHIAPRPVLFADTNWVKDFFAFVVNPGNLDLEFWSVDAYGLCGRPVSHWKMWLNGSKKEPSWGVFCKPYEYVGR